MINVVLGITQFDVKFDLRQEISTEIFHFSIEGLRYLDMKVKRPTPGLVQRTTQNCGQG